MRLTAYWAKIDQFFTPFYSNMMKRNGSLDILCFLHLMDNRYEVDSRDENYDKLWKILDISKILNRTHQNFTTLQKMWQLTKLLCCSK